VCVTTFHELNISDLHIPYLDPAAWDLALAVVEYVKPDVINILGDLVDFYELSTFDKDPEKLKAGGLQRQLDLSYLKCSELKRAAPKAKLRYVPGNHEDRLRRYLMRHNELHDLRVLELPSLLNLKELEIEFYESEIAIIPGILYGRHGTVVRGESGYSANGELARQRYAVSLITGHTHRLGTTYVRTRNTLIKGMENGCLCSLNPEYVEHPNWQQGMTLVTHWGGELFDATDIPFLGYGERLKAVVLGNEVRL
jgi:UDP-2,3-diacylglucosamine pyrophosphatase LpxH